MRAARIAVVAVAALLAVAPACSHKEDAGTVPGSGEPDLPPLRIRDDTPNLMLTWIDDHGEAHVELRPADVPAEARAQVRVVVSDREEGTHERFYVVDLNRRESDGAYGCQSMRRHDWEDIIAKRREAYLAKVSPPPPTPPPPSSGSAPAPAPAGPPTAAPNAASLTVVIYGAKWCRPCHDAAAYLRGKGIQVVMKDVDEDPLAQEEMQEKLSRIGQRGGSIPIIDVRGQILVGFSPPALDRAVAKALGGTTL